MMNRKACIYLILALSLFSCGRNRAGIIPRETMADIYHDIYLLDQSILRHREYHDLSDSVLIYEPIFEKYGYHFDDYTTSVNYYLRRPDKFSKIFSEVRRRYEARLRVIEDSLAAEAGRSVRWELLDSIRTLGTDSSLTTPLFRALDMMFFTKDTALLTEYPLPDSSILKSYKLTVFELYEGNPFRIDSLPRRPLIMVPDSASRAQADSVRKAASVPKASAGEKTSAHRSRSRVRDTGRPTFKSNKN